MFIAYAVTGVLLALALLVSGGGKLVHEKHVVEGLTGIGVPLGLFPFLAACEIAGAGGLLVGLWYAPLGIAAAIGIALYFLGAIGAHVRKGDYKALSTPLAILIFSVVVLSLRVASA
jgi:hypothetical protein